VSGEGFVASVTDYLLLAVMASKTVDDLLQLIFQKHPALDAWKQRFPEAAPAPAWSGVSVLRLRTGWDSAAADEDADQKDNTKLFTAIRQITAANRVCIVVNGAEASFADLLLFLPGGVWLPLRVKRYFNTPITRLDAWEELSTMGMDCSEARHACIANANTPQHIKTATGKTLPSFFKSLVGGAACPDELLQCGNIRHAARVKFAETISKAVYPEGTGFLLPGFIVGHGSQGQAEPPSFKIPSEVLSTIVDITAPHHNLYPVRPSVDDGEEGFSCRDLSFSDLDKVTRRTPPK
jgi:hypothetical protein